MSWPTTRRKIPRRTSARWLHSLEDRDYKGLTNPGGNAANSLCGRRRAFQQGDTAHAVSSHRAPAAVQDRCTRNAGNATDQLYAMSKVSKLNPDLK
ncbi:hypothetical protein B5X24_HaOG211475 [Helicoverpa armigera]|nr:hypothetical protein B5X24_HaOG211475 [Helicoverpa armigera]